MLEWFKKQKREGGPGSGRHAGPHDKAIAKATSKYNKATGRADSKQSPKNDQKRADAAKQMVKAHDDKISSIKAELEKTKSEYQQKFGSKKAPKSRLII